MASQAPSALGHPFNLREYSAPTQRHDRLHTQKTPFTTLAGRQIVDMVNREVHQSHILTHEAFENAIRVSGAIDGSTNAVVHLIAIAGRMGVPPNLDDWDQLGRDIPTIVNLMPSGKSKRLRKD